ncbi:MAG: CDP-alcohol phosphatidyltransferase family protein [Flavobacteriales bacterium]|nr:CDP-alcohol phosphatidyltransferase family protein [Flavobacteriales bacterium]
MIQREHINVPNLLSGYRLVLFPVLVYLLLTDNYKPFQILFIINLITDILDGFIARRFNLQTAFGARLDSLADMGSYAVAIAAMFLWYFDSFGNLLWLFIFFLAAYAAAMLFSMVKFGQFPSLHLYSCKTAGYVQGIFFFVLFTYGFVRWLFILGMIVGCLAYLEELAVLIKLSELKSNVKSIFKLKNNA